MRQLHNKYIIITLVLICSVPFAFNSALLFGKIGTEALTLPFFLSSFGLIGLIAVIYSHHLGFKSLRRDLKERTIEADRLEAFVASAKMPYCGWTEDKAQVLSQDFLDCLGLKDIEKPEDLEDALLPGDAAAFNHAWHELETQQKTFTLRVSTLENKQVELIGRIGQDENHRQKFNVLWLNDISDHRKKLKTAQKQYARESLNRQRFENALNKLQFPVWIRDPNSRLTWCNDAYASAVESTTEQTVEKQLQFSTTNSASLSELSKEALKTQKPTNLKSHVVINGHRHLLELTEVPFETGTIGFALDQTESEKSSAELSRHIEAHAEVLEHLGSGIAVFGTDTKLTFFNRAYIQQWDFDETWLNTKPTYGELLEDLRTRRKLTEYADFVSFKKEQLSLFTSLIDPEESLMHLPDGRHMRSLMAAHPFGGLILINEDVTSFYDVTGQLHTMLEVHKETLDNLAEGIAVFGADGKIKLFNPAFSKIWNLQAEDLQKEQHLSDFMELVRDFFADLRDWDVFKNEVIGALSDRTAGSGRFSRTDNSIIEFTNVPLPDGGILYSILDITDTVRVENALRKSNAALEEADRLKSEFIANVSYQLRTPLNAIMGFTEILTNQYFGSLNDKQMEYANNVLEAGNRLLSLINDILDLANIEAGYLKLEHQRIDIVELIKSVAELSEDWARKQNIEIDLEYDQELGDIEVDVRRIKQALYNLVSNSVKFTPNGGLITIRAERLSNRVKFTVIDTGIGIALDDQQRVMGKFEKVIETNSQHSGAGLGLALVRSIVEMHGGELQLESRPNEGTKISIVLPLVAPSDLSQSGVVTHHPLKKIKDGVTIDFSKHSPPEHNTDLISD